MVKKDKGLIILSQYFYPDLASTAQLLTELAEDLKGYGYNIKVYTGKPSYLKNRTKTKKKEIYKEISIYRVTATRFNKNNIIGRVSNFFSYFLSVFFKLLFQKDRYPLLIVSNPPFLSIIGLLFKKTRKQKYIYLIHDIYPDIAVALGYLKEKSIIAKLWDKINYQVLINAEKVAITKTKISRELLRYLKSVNKPDSIGKKIKLIFQLYKTNNNIRREGLEINLNKRRLKEIANQRLWNFIKRDLVNFKLKNFLKKILKKPDG